MQLAATLSETAVESVVRRLHDERIDVVIVGGCDLNGVFRGRFVPTAVFERGPANAVPICDVIWAFDYAEALMPPPPGGSHWFPPMETGFGDCFGRPDLGTFRRVPWLPNTAMVLCDYERPDGSPIEFAPRTVLARCVDEAETRGLVPKLAPEFEFFLSGEPRRWEIEQCRATITDWELSRYLELA